LPLRFAAVASDALSGESVVLDGGTVGMAVAASCAAPVRNAPVPVGNRQLLDGGLTAPVPVAVVRRLDVNHLMRKRLDVEALIEAGEAALLQVAPKLLQR
jgi:predicted acylesterase/phospholipase RssA